jgi:hypothetical protein
MFEAPLDIIITLRFMLVGFKLIYLYVCNLKSSALVNKLLRVEHECAAVCINRSFLQVQYSCDYA